MKKKNMISREEILDCIKKHSIYCNKKYSIFTMLKYNIDIEPTDVSFLLDKDYSEIQDAFLSPIKTVDEISILPSISMFQDLNELFILLREEEKTTHKNRNSTTRRVYIGSRHQKISRKQLKS
jgi:tRNA G10  N-methylase Trm11